jgi:adenosine/AMP kinase
MAATPYESGIVKLNTVRIVPGENCNVMVGTAHFIKTVEDLYEALAESVPNLKFGIGFCESSGPCLVRSEGNDDALRRLAAKTAYDLSCGHCFVIFIKNAFPINVLNRVKQVSEVCTIHAATANPLQVIVCETEQGRGIVGVVDGSASKGIETERDVKERRRLLRRIGYRP